jgi:mono/diheme cytochrome c family protein
MRRGHRSGLFFIAAVILLATETIAAPTPEQANLAKSVSTRLKKAGNLYRARKITDSAEALREAQSAFDELLETGDPAEVALLARPLRANLEKALQLLSLEGQKFDALPSLPEAGAKPGAKPAVRGSAADGISFVKQIAPLLIGKCGGCHVNQAKGGFSMASFAALMKGSKEGGTVVQPGSGDGSRIVEVIASGDMPRGGGKVSPADLALLSKWIDEGAKFDGNAPDAMLTSLAAAKPDKPAELVKVAQATGKEDVLFARDIGPVLVSNCLGCHGNNNPRGDLSMATFNGILKGGENGSILVPGKPAESLIVQKLRGQAGARMPLNRPALDEATIAKFEKWIAGGAKFDGPDMTMPTADVVQLLFAARSTHEELSAERAKIAQRTWKLTLPDSKANQHESDNLLVMGNLPVEVLVEVAKAAEDLLPRIGKMLGAPADKPLIKGRLTLFVFNKRYDYGEIGTMVEQRELPANSRGHFRFTGVDAYACVVPPKPGDTQPLDSLLAQQIAGAYVASLGKVPSWFAEGSGRLAASKINPKDARFKEWDGRLPGIIAEAGKGDAAVSGKLPGEAGGIAAYGFVKALAGSSKYSAVLNALRAGEPFDKAFLKAYRGTPMQVAGAWVPKAGRGSR